MDPRRDRVQVDGRPVRPERLVHLVLNKPRDVLCTCHDPSGRRTFLKLLPDFGVRLYPVGRLDRNSEGLLIVTNDGALAQSLMHPGREVPRRYRVRVAAPLTLEQRRRIREGMVVDGERLQVDELEPLPEEGPATYAVVLHEGRNREIRRIFEALRVPVEALKRLQFGPLELGDLRSGRWRRLTPREVRALLRCGRPEGAPRSPEASAREEFL
jgi:23S rRNA pseudouridine2605 synthase